MNPHHSTGLTRATAPSPMSSARARSRVSTHFFCIRAARVALLDIRGADAVAGAEQHRVQPQSAVADASVEHPLGNRREPALEDELGRVSRPVDLWTARWNTESGCGELAGHDRSPDPCPRGVLQGSANLARSSPTGSQCGSQGNRLVWRSLTRSRGHGFAERGQAPDGHGPAERDLESGTSGLSVVPTSRNV